MKKWWSWIETNASLGFMSSTALRGIPAHDPTVGRNGKVPIERISVGLVSCVSRCAATFQPGGTRTRYPAARFVNQSAWRTAWRGDTHTPAASPDGHTIVYKRWNSWRTKPVNGQALYVVNLDGSNNHRVTPWKLGAGDHPGFSPDGSKILFRSFEEQESEQSEFWTVHPDGSGLTQLSHVRRGTLVRSAAYSPDGTWIVHATDGVDGNADIFVMRADGTGNQPVTRSKLWDSAPDWGPAGS